MISIARVSCPVRLTVGFERLRGVGEELRQNGLEHLHEGRQVLVEADRQEVFLYLPLGALQGVA